MHKTRKLKKSEKSKLETLPQHKNSLELDFDRSSQSIQSQLPIQKQVSKPRTQRSRPKKVSIR